MRQGKHAHNANGFVLTSHGGEPKAGLPQQSSHCWEWAGILVRTLCYTSFGHKKKRALHPHFSEGEEARQGMHPTMTAKNSADTTGRDKQQHG